MSETLETLNTGAIAILLQTTLTLGGGLLLLIPLRKMPAAARAAAARWTIVATTVSIVLSLTMATPRRPLQPTLKTAMERSAHQVEAVPATVTRSASTPLRNPATATQTD